MSTPILGLCTTIYKTADLEAAKAWYAKAFQTEPYYDQAPYVGFNVAGYDLGLFLDDTATPDGADNVLTYWGVEDMDAAMAHFQSLNTNRYSHRHPLDLRSVDRFRTGLDGGFERRCLRER